MLLLAFYDCRRNIAVDGLSPTGGTRRCDCRLTLHAHVQADYGVFFGRELLRQASPARISTTLRLCEVSILSLTMGPIPAKANLVARLFISIVFVPTAIGAIDRAIPAKEVMERGVSAAIFPWFMLVGRRLEFITTNESERRHQSPVRPFVNSRDVIW
jgi:hypothetical protein